MHTSTITFMDILIKENVPKIRHTYYGSIFIINFCICQLTTHHQFKKKTLWNPELYQDARHEEDAMQGSEF